MMKPVSLRRLTMKLSSKFGTTNGGCNGYIQTLRRFTPSRMGRYKEFLINERLCLGADAISLITHDEQSQLEEMMGNLGSIEGIKDIAENILGLTDPDSIVIQPEN